MTTTILEPLPDRFTGLIARLTGWLDGRAIVPALGAELYAAFPPDGEFFAELARSCIAGLDAGWLGARGEMPLRYGRVIKPTPKTRNFSIDVVKMADVAGPHHEHPNGEIDMIVPLDPGATFDGCGAGWLVYGPQSAHAPTVSGGTAAILYMLPGGAIRF